MFKTLFIIALILAAICAAITLYYRHRYNTMVGETNGNKRALRRLEFSDEFGAVCDHGSSAFRWMWIFLVIAAILLILTLVFAGNKDKSSTDDLATTQPTTTAYADSQDIDTEEDEDTISSDVIFYNDEMQGKDNGQEFNFGPSAYTDGITGDEARAELLRRCEHDPVLLAAVDSWLDANLGTNLCGVFYEDNAEWRQGVNDYASAMAYDPELFEEQWEATEALINSAKPSVEEMGSNIVDQMYMLPKQYSGNEIPQLIVMATEHSKGHNLALKFNIKGDNSFVVKFRMECGFQPTNCSEKLETQPTAKPAATKKSSGKGGGGTTPTKPKKPDKPDKPDKPKGDGCKDKQTWTPSGGQKVEKRTDTPTGGGNSHDNTQDKPSGGATRVDEGSGGGSKTPDKPKDPPVVDSGNGMVNGDD